MVRDRNSFDLSQSSRSPPTRSPLPSRSFLVPQHLQLFPSPVTLSLRRINLYPPAPGRPLLHLPRPHSGHDRPAILGWHRIRASSCRLISPFTFRETRRRFLCFLPSLPQTLSRPCPLFPCSSFHPLQPTVKTKSYSRTRPRCLRTASSLSPPIVLFLRRQDRRKASSSATSISSLSTV